MASESGCPIEFHRIDVDKCDPVFDKECQGNKYIPFLRADYDRRTGRSPNSPREQVIRGFHDRRAGYRPPGGLHREPLRRIRFQEPVSR